MMKTTALQNSLPVSLSAICLLAVSSCSSSGRSDHEKPNVLLLLADDLGYAELGCYGQEAIETPNLDRLASMGVRFSDYHSGNAVSSPARAVLMTGIPSGYNTIRGNMGTNLENGGTRVALKKSEITLAEMLKGAGYQTAFIGKWHLETPNDLSTWAFARGFDYAVQEQWSDINTTRNYTVDMEYVNGVQDSIFYDCKKWDCKDEFRTQIAFDYLDTQYDKKKPLFMFMSYRAPHAHEWYINNKELYADRGWTEAERMHAAKVTLLDRQIGRMLDKLEQMGILDNTLIVFTSDNGPQNEGHDYDFFEANGQMRGYKRDLFEGGHRVPLIAYWKGYIDSGEVLDFTCAGQDIVPTIIDAVGVELIPQVQGLSLLPSIMSGDKLKRDALYWELLDAGFSRQAVRMENWKAVRYGTQNPIRLYDLSSDIGETLDLSSQRPDIIARMAPLFEQMRVKSNYFPRVKENVKDRFLSVRTPRSYVIGDKIDIAVDLISENSAQITIDYELMPCRLKENKICDMELDQPYLIRSILFEDNGVEIIRTSQAMQLNGKDQKVDYQQQVITDNLSPNKDYYVRCEVARSICVNNEVREEVIDAVVTLLNITDYKELN